MNQTYRSGTRRRDTQTQSQLQARVSMPGAPGDAAGQLPLPLAIPGVGGGTGRD